MYTLGFVLLGIGALIGFVAFAFAGINMVKGTKGSAKNMFGNHVGAMIAMGFGGLVSGAGVIVLIVTAIKNLF